MIFFLFDEKNEPADIFSEIPSEKQGSPPDQLPETAASAVISAPETVTRQAAFGWKGALVLGLVVVLIGGAATVFFSLRGSKAPEKPGAQTSEQQPSQQAPEPQPEPQPEQQPQAVPQAQQPEIDSDGDGLTDVREAQLGTNSGMVDSDGDELSDREEVEVYMTDPNNADTDADAYKDGEEVKNGYNPKGAGKLLQIPLPQ